MNTAVLNAAPAEQAKTTSAFSLIFRNVVNALAESRAKSAERALRRYDSLRADLSRKQDHSADFLSQTTDLPFKI